MNWPRIRLSSTALVAVWAITGCGVKGDPLPPEKPVELGRGRPTYKRAIEGIQIEKGKPASASRPGRKTDDEGDEDGSN